ncbi:hypothetical protein ACSU04_14340 [Microbacterium sp. A84]
MIDTTTPMGRALYGIVAVFAPLPVDTIRDNSAHKLGLDPAAPDLDAAGVGAADENVGFRHLAWNPAQWIDAN